MLEIKVICAGKLKEKYLAAACDEYLKRLRPLANVTVCQVNEDTVHPDGLAREAAVIEKEIPKGAYVIPMCIEGQQMTSEQLAQTVAQLQSRGVSCLCFIIGSSNGLEESIKQKGSLRLSMSKMTFPHHLARVMLLEQIYRALSILGGGKYHK